MGRADESRPRERVHPPADVTPQGHICGHLGSSGRFAAPTQTSNSTSRNRRQSDPGEHIGPPTPRANEQGYQLYVVELDDAVGPRRRPDRSHLYIGITSLDPAERLRLDRKPAARTKAGVRDHGRRLRPDLAPPSEPMAIEDAQRTKRVLVDRLRRDGWGANGERRVWRVYVIELSDDIGPRANPALPWVYVGQSSLTPEQRMAQHLGGVRNGNGKLYSTWPHRYGRRLLPELYEAEPERYCANDAKAAERELADRLRNAGYSLKGGH